MITLSGALLGGFQENIVNCAACKIDTWMPYGFISERRACGRSHVLQTTGNDALLHCERNAAFAFVSMSGLPTPAPQRALRVLGRASRVDGHKRTPRTDSRFQAHCFESLPS